jgi:hypothetical protein
MQIWEKLAVLHLNAVVPYMRIVITMAPRKTSTRPMWLVIRAHSVDKTVARMEFAFAQSFAKTTAS